MQGPATELPGLPTRRSYDLPSRAQILPHPTGVIVSRGVGACVCMVVFFGKPGKGDDMRSVCGKRSIVECASILAARRLRRFGTSEDGGLIIMSLFFFITMIMMTGLAVDIMRFETARIVNQATMDRAVLAAAGLDQELDPRDVVIDYYTKAGMTPPPRELITVEEAYVGGTEDAEGNQIGGELVSRRVEIVSAVESPNMFSNWVNVYAQFGQKYEDYAPGAAPALVEKFSAVATSAALERIQNVEISLVVDISGSMGSNNRMRNLKTAAYEFFETVVDEDRTEGITSVSIIPYNATVVVGDLLDYLNADGTTVDVLNPPSHPGAITSYATEHNNSTCVRFADSDFESVVIDATTPLTRISDFKEGRDGYSRPTPRERWCNDRTVPGNETRGRAPILVHSTSVTELSDHIRSLRTGGWTGVDNGVKWGAALLDPAMRPVVAEMIADGRVSARAENRPNDYAPTETIKVLVVMTDGANTIQRDLRDRYKNGPTKIWHSHEAWSTAGPGFPTDPDHVQAPWDTSNRVPRWDPDLGRNLSWRDGFFVEMTERWSGQRWYRPGHWNTTADNRFYGEATLDALPDAKQLDHLTLYERFAEEDIARFFFQYADNNEYDNYRRAVYDFERYGSIDRRLSDICAAARDQGITVFTLAFEAPEGGKRAMRDCATNQGEGGFYYETDGTGISDAFRSIAGQITQLRLTQ